MQKHFARLIELLEIKFMILRVHTDTGIFDSNLDLWHTGVTSNNTATYSNTATIRRVLDCVDNDMIEKFIEQTLVANDDWQGLESFCNKAKMTFFQCRFKGQPYLFDNLVKLNFRRKCLKQVIIYTRDVQHVVDNVDNA